MRHTGPDVSRRVRIGSVASLRARLGREKEAQPLSEGPSEGAKWDRHVPRGPFVEAADLYHHDGVLDATHLGWVYGAAESSSRSPAVARSGRLTPPGRSRPPTSGDQQGGRVPATRSR